MAVTTGVTLLFAYLIFWELVPLYDHSPARTLILCSIMLGTYGYCFLQRPLRYSILKDTFIVNRLVKNWSIDCHEIKSVRLFTHHEMKFTIRTFGVGGLFGYFGMFFNSKEGRLRLFATRWDRTVLIETAGGKKIIVTPNDPDAFVSILKWVRRKEGAVFACHSTSHNA